MRYPPPTGHDESLDDVEITACPRTVVFDRATADRALQNNYPRHFRGLLEAVRDFACGLMMVFQNKQPFEIAACEPWMMLIGDDTLWALGPGGFDRLSLEEVVRKSGYAAIVAGAAHHLPYNIAATCAARDRKNVVLIETQPKQWTLGSISYGA